MRLQQTCLGVQSNRLRDVAGRAQSPYLLNNIFAFHLPISTLSSTTGTTFTFKPEYFFTNTGKTIQKIELDGGDGQGFKTVSWNQEHKVFYTSDGVKTLTLRFTYTDGSTYSGLSEITINGYYGGPQAIYSPCGPLISGCETVNINPVAGLHSGATVTIVRSTSHQANKLIIKPLIIVEGYDVSSVAPLLAPAYTVNDFITAIGNRFTFPFDFNRQLDDIGGYDIFFVDFNNAVDDIKRNAEVVKTVILLANQKKSRLRRCDQNGVCNDIFEPNVVMGLSMGGLVGRYALADMEKQFRVSPTDANKHETRLLITHDSPHKGANVPLGIQCMVGSLTELGFKILGPALSAIVVSFKDLIPPISQYDKFLSAPANPQLLITRAEKIGTGGSAFNFINNTFLEGEYRTMITFPANAPPPYKMVASSNGSECGLANFAPYSEIIRVEGNFFVSPLTRFISQTRWNTQLIVNALPAAGQSRRIYYGKIWVNYKILSLININITLWQNSVNNPTNTFPYDGAAGGKFTMVNNGIDNKSNLDILVFGFETNMIVKPNFCFVPVSSALDVTDSYSTAVLSKSYYGGMTPSPSRFANFVAAPKNPSGVFNENHIQFTSNNTKWMFNEMENSLNTPNIVNCAYLCTPPQITRSGGGSNICINNNSLTYQLNPAPPTNATVVWRASPANNVLIESPNSFTTKIKGVEGNNVTITADIFSDCGFVTASKIYGVGVPFVTTTIDNKQVTTTPTNLCANREYIFQASDGTSTTNFTWALQSPNPYVFLSNTTGNTCRVSATQPTNFLLVISKPSNCGTGTRNMPIIMDNTCIEPFRIFPNPTPDVVAVSTNNPDAIVSLQILDKFGVVQKQVDEAYLKSSEIVSSKKEIKFDLRNLQNGVYYLHITTNQGTTKHQIVKE